MADENARNNTHDLPLRNTPFQRQTGVDEQGRRIVAIYDELGNLLAEGPVKTVPIFKIAGPIEYGPGFTEETP